MCLSSICSNRQEWILWKWRLMLGIWSGKRRGEQWNIESAVCRLWLWITVQILHHGGAVAVLDKQVEALSHKELTDIETQNCSDDKITQEFLYTRTKRYSISIYKSETTDTLLQCYPSHMFWVLTEHRTKHWDFLNFTHEWDSYLANYQKREYHAKNFPKKERFTSYLYKIASKYLALLEISSASSHRNKPLNTLRM